jgi:hypothetical protein
VHFRRPSEVALALLLGLPLLATAVAGGSLRTAASDSSDSAQARAGLASDVVDPLFGFLLDVIDRDLFGNVDAAFLDSLASANGGSRLPVHLIRSIERDQSSRLDARVRFRFFGEVKTPIPYSILRYNPGSIRASSELELEHWSLGDQRLQLPADEGDSNVSFVGRRLELFVISEGRMKMDIDGWLDKLMRGKLDDVDLSGFLLFFDGDRRIGLGFGYSTKHRGRTGAFDFTANESIFPAPKAYLVLGRLARELGEELHEAPTAPRQLRGAALLR